MADGEEWLLRPVLAGCCRYESLVDGTLNLADVMLMNDALDVQGENEWRYRDAKERERGS